jgi:hypothetical protein
MGAACRGRRSPAAGDNDGWGGGKKICARMRTMIGEGKKKIWTGGGGDGIFSPIFISIILSPMYFFSTLIIPGLNLMAMIPLD